MKLSRHNSPYLQLSEPAPDAPLHQRGTLIELLTVLAIIGVLICDKKPQ